MRTFRVPVCAFVGSSLYEAGKQYLFPEISLWYSHLLTIVLFTSAALIVSLIEERRAARVSRSEHNLHSLVRSAPYGMFRSTLDGTILTANPALCKLLGYDSETELTGVNLNSVYCDPEERKHLWKALLADGAIRDLEVTWRRKDASIAVVTLNGTLRAESGHENIFEASAADVTTTRRAEQELHRLNRSLTTLSKCNEALVRAQSERELLQGICELLVQLGGHRLAWVGYAENDPDRSVRPVAKAGDDQGYVQQARISWADTERGQGPVGSAIRLSEVQVVHSIAASSSFAPWREEARKRGLNSAVSLPLKIGAEMLGALAIYSIEPDAFDPKEVELLRELANDLAYGIASLRNAEKRRQVEQELRDSERRYRGLFLSNPHPMFVFEVETLKFVDVNAAALSHYGYSRDEFLGLTLKDIRPPGDIDFLFKVLGEARPGYQFRGCFRHAKKDGTVFDVEIASYRFLQDGKLLSLSLANDVTERKKAEQALRESEARYRNIIATSQEGVLVADKNRAITLANPRAVELLGYTLDEILGKDLLEIIPEERREQVIGDLERGRTDAQRLEYWTRKKDGTPIYLMVSGSPVLDDVGEFDGWLGMLSDLTDFKCAEEALRKSEERFQLASRATQEIIWDWDIVNDQVWYSDRFWEVFGYDRERFPVAVQGWAELVHPEDDWIIAPQYDEYTSTKYRMKRADGTWAHVLDRAYLISGPSGERLRKVGILSDISQAKEAEQALRESEGRYRTLFEQDFVGVFYSRPGKMLDCNDAMCQMFGYSRDEMLAVDVLTLYESLTDRETGQQRLLKEHQLTNHQVRLRRKDGTAITVLANLKLVGSEQDPVIAGVLLDISETEALQEQLSQAQKLEAVGRLSGGIAHDFNNILMIISSYSEMLLDFVDKQSPPFKFVGEIRTAVDRGASLVRQLLAFSRKQIMTPVVMCIDSVLAELKQVLKRLIGEDIQLEISWESSLWPIKADPSQIQQVIMNLVVNARDAMPSGGSLSITSANVELSEEFVRNNPGSRTGQYIVITVSDTGCGIPYEVQSRIFEPFFTTKQKGTGLGLSMVYGTVKQSGGYIRVESEPAKGTTFFVYLPRTAEAALTPKILASAVLLTKRARVLLVEDEAPTRNAVANYLEQNGFQVLPATTAEEALQICCRGDREPIDVLLTDVVMPGGNGVELARAFEHRYPDARIVFMSGYSDEHVALSEVAKRPKSVLLYKPFRFSELVDALNCRIETNSAGSPDRTSACGFGRVDYV